VFVFFSNRLGCVGSLLVSAVATLILLALLRLIQPPTIASSPGA